MTLAGTGFPEMGIGEDKKRGRPLQQHSPPVNQARWRPGQTGSRNRSRPNGTVYWDTSCQWLDLAEARTASQTRVVSKASRKVGLVDLLPATLVRKSATWCTKECS